MGDMAAGPTQCINEDPHYGGNGRLTTSKVQPARARRDPLQDRGGPIEWTKCLIR